MRLEWEEMKEELETSALVFGMSKDEGFLLQHRAYIEQNI